MGAEQSALVTQNGEGLLDDPRYVVKDSVSFFINGNAYTVNATTDKLAPTYPLADFIRDKAGLKGTKTMCREGGCGACVVMVKVRDPVRRTETVRAVNSCLIPVFAADGWEITTVEHLGNKKVGYHPIQQSVVKFSASQCGFCTPGMVMNMYSLEQRNPSFTMADVEDSFDGNLCRCTGYRPILAAFKSLASDAPHELRMKAVNANASCNGCNLKDACCKTRDIEDLECCTGLNQVRLKLTSGEEWIKVTSLANLYTVLGAVGGNMYRLVAGNTGTGVFKDDGPYNTFIDVNSVPELKQVNLRLSQGAIRLGGGTTIAEAIEYLQQAADNNPTTHWYLAGVSKHFKRVANVPVRNVGTLAGNLMMKHAHRGMASDIFFLLEAVGARILVGTSPDVQREYTALEFREVDMNRRVIVSITFPEIRGDNYHFRSFKITRRYQNSRAYVNGAILLRVDPNQGFRVVERPRIVLGGLSAAFVHATQTEAFLEGRNLDVATIVSAMQTLGLEINPTEDLPGGSPEYRRTLAQSLLYKTIVAILGNAVRGDLRSAGTDLEHGPSSGQQVFDANQSEWPIGQPIHKLEAVYQASGEAEYINDIDPRHGELYGAFVLTTVANATLSGVDASEALMIPGVEAFVQASDIPGTNNFVVYYPQPEEIFVSDRIRHAGQPVGLILADTRDKAVEAAKKVRVSYDNVERPVLNISDALFARGKENNLMDYEVILGRFEKELIKPIKATRTVKGEFRSGSQYHMHMETQTCLSVPTEDGIDVYPSSQFVNAVHLNVASALNIPHNSVNIRVRRLGGGFGGKLGKSAHTATACAVAAHVVNRPVRVVLDLETNMRAIGKRLPYLVTYEVTADEATGKISNLRATLTCDTGYSPNEATSLEAMMYFPSCYSTAGWTVTPGKVTTNTAPNTYCRSPGSTQAIASVEMIMEHIAYSLNKDPLDVKMANFLQSGDPLIIPGQRFQGENPLPQMIIDFKRTTSYDERKAAVNEFNRTNRYRKRGLSMMPMRYEQDYFGDMIRYPVYIAVCAGDASVSVTHGGIEMGQGINTKCAQVVAKFLNIPVDKIQVKPTNNLTAPNTAPTGGAIGSELVCHAAMKAAQQLNEKMEPVRRELGNPSWEQLVTACHARHIMLTAQHMDKPGPDLQGYGVWALCLNEVEIDVLTGEYNVLRVDILEDVGYSISPNVDIGQIEGAFVMGLGYWTTERLVYNQNTGELLTNNTWDYKPPFSKDIPEDFRVTMLKNRPNPTGVLRSKTTGEAPLVLSASILTALRNAIDSARRDAGNTDWYRIDGPIGPEEIQRLCLVDPARFEI